ncbi:hypothetical protein BJY04DRAFT_216488 [Aspergillus karnatakaensis]|uniref:uncharacterized protein n=1 Tax=Aspergillus karnatakaensis TaxID=1810916 RepID=UPI003CCDA209
MSDSPYLCTQCPAFFRRQEHLDRHSLSHGGDRPFRCKFCDHSFKRSDVLQRHWRTCKARLDIGAGIPLIPHGPRPKRRRACDGCVRLKKACNLQSPCGGCLSRKQQCTYANKQPPQFKPSPTPEFPSRQTELSLCENRDFTGVSLLGSWLDPSRLVDNGTTVFASLPETGLESLAGLELSKGDGFAFGGFHFLARFTSMTGFMSSFECMRVSESRELARVVAELPLDDGPDADDSELFPDSFSLDFFSFPSALARSPGSDLNSCFNCKSSLFDPLSLVTNDLVCRLKHVTIHPGPGSPITLQWSPLIERICFDFFSPSNIRRYLEYFWSLWYPNCPIIHKPTFDIHSTPLTLLISMLLVGASFAPEESVHQNAKVWCNTAEEIVFADEHFRRAVSLGDGTEADSRLRRDALKALQAAYLMCLLQNWEGDDDSKRRIRRSRFSMVTAIARELGFSPGSHHEPTTEEEDWKRFVAREEFNRTLSYIFLLDTAFVIFNNTPPKVSISELNFDPVCPEHCFQAPTAADFFLLMFEQDVLPSPLPNLSIAALISLVCNGGIDITEKEYIAGLGKLNLFIIVSAFHTLLFHARNTFAPQAAILPIQQGLDNWKAIWSQHEGFSTGSQGTLNGSPPSPKECWKRVGFMEYAPEYWTLAQAIIFSFRKAEVEGSGILGQSPVSQLGMMLSRFDENDMKQLNRFIRWAGHEGLVRVG